MNDYRRYAPAGLVLSGLAFLTLIGSIFVRALSASRMVTIDQETLTSVTWASVAVMALGIGGAALLNPDGARKLLTGRQIKNGSNSLIMLLAVTGILIFANIMSVTYPASRDLTENQENTFAPETLEIVKGISQPVVVRAYYTPESSTEEVVKLLDRYKKEAKNGFTYEIINPNINPAQAQEDGVTRDGTVVLIMGAAKETVQYPTEQEITGALVRLTSPEKRPIYFITGHGERDLNGQSEQSYSAAKTALEGKNYVVKQLSLLAAGNVPADAKVVILAGPQTPLKAEEVTALEAYLDAGGSLIVMQDPGIITQFGEQKDTMADLLTKWGVTLNNDFVINPNSALGASNPVADPSAYQQHPITEKLTGVYTVFPRSRSITLDTNNQSVSISALAVSTTDAWGETDLESLKNNQVDIDEKDTPGPVTLAAVGENYTSGGRLVVFGSSEIASDQVYSQGFGDIFINSVDWAAKNEKAINLTVKTPIERKARPINQWATIGLFLGSVCLIPLLVIGVGVAVWASRRRQ